MTLVILRILVGRGCQGLFGIQMRLRLEDKLRQATLQLEQLRQANIEFVHEEPGATTVQGILISASSSGQGSLQASIEWCNLLRQSFRELKNESSSLKAVPCIVSAYFMWGAAGSA